MTMPEKKRERKVVDPSPQVLHGVYMFPNGDRYEGDYTMDKGSIERNGQGKHASYNGTVYEGQWCEDRMTGKGKLSHPSGASYEGDFVNNQFHGIGRYTWRNGAFYEGQFVQNRLEGAGEFTDTVGQQWTGQFLYKAAPGLRFKLKMG